MYLFTEICHQRRSIRGRKALRSWARTVAVLIYGTRTQALHDRRGVFASPRALARSTYESVQWSSFLPHI